ncbi:hypothetical protein AB837_00494 [bacterium AB1]|nr:hypothetical protein AB837_00494 [bacterium AB1]
MAYSTLSTNKASSPLKKVFKAKKRFKKSTKNIITLDSAQTPSDSQSISKTPSINDDSSNNENDEIFVGGNLSTIKEEEEEEKEEEEEEKKVVDNNNYKNSNANKQEDKPKIPVANSVNKNTENTKLKSSNFMFVSLLLIIIMVLGALGAAGTIYYYYYVKKNNSSLKLNKVIK